MVNGKEMVNTFYAQVKRFRKAPVIECIVLFKIHLVLVIVRKQQELTHEFQDNGWKIVSTIIFRKDTRSFIFLDATSQI